MSADLLIILVGALLLLLAFGHNIKIKDSSLGLVNPKLRVTLGIIGVILIMYGGFSYGTVNLPGQLEQVTLGNVRQIEYPVKRVQVLSPIPGDSVNCRILTKGVYPDAHDKDIWVLLKPSDEKYYPQSDHTNTSYKREGEWQVITRFGGDEGETFKIIVYEADAAASEFFSTTIANWKAANSYPGLQPEEIPESVQVVDSMRVVLNKNCRGAHDTPEQDSSTL